MATSPAPTTRVIWSWRSNSDPWNEQQKKEWQRYSDLEIDLVEGEYQNKAKSVELGGYVIDFQQMLQYRKGHEHRQRPVKREMVAVSKYLRKERFCFAEKLQNASSSSGSDGSWTGIVANWFKREQPKDTKSFVTDSSWDGSIFISKWKQRNEKLWLKDNYREIVEQAVQGIRKEGRLLNKEPEAQLIADRLTKARDKTIKEINDCCIHLYSMNSFLYKLVNASMRNGDFAKVDTLGAYCWLLNGELHDDVEKDQTVYRGCTLSVDMIEDYKQAVGTRVWWLSFTSTSKCREAAEMFSGNTLFIIHLSELYRQKDISALSHYSDEDEVLLSPSRYLKMEKVDYDEITKKYLIYLSDW